MEQLPQTKLTKRPRAALWARPRVSAAPAILAGRLGVLCINEQISLSNLNECGKLRPRTEELRLVASFGAMAVVVVVAVQAMACASVFPTTYSSVGVLVFLPITYC